MPTAIVNFIAIGESFEDLIDQAIEELWESDGDAVLSEEDRQRMFANLTSELEFATDEVLDLGTFTDFDRLFDILSLADDQAEDWEAQLVPFDEEEFDEPDVYDLYVDDSEEEDYEEEDEDDEDQDDEDQDDEAEDDEDEDDEDEDDNGEADAEK